MLFCMGNVTYLLDNFVTVGKAPGYDIPKCTCTFIRHAEVHLTSQGRILCNSKVQSVNESFVKTQL